MQAILRRLRLVDLPVEQALPFRDVDVAQRRLARPWRSRPSLFAQDRVSLVDQHHAPVEDRSQRQHRKRAGSRHLCDAVRSLLLDHPYSPIGRQHDQARHVLELPVLVDDEQAHPDDERPGYAITPGEPPDRRQHAQRGRREQDVLHVLADQPQQRLRPPARDFRGKQHVIDVGDEVPHHQPEANGHHRCKPCAPGQSAHRARVGEGVKRSSRNACREIGELQPEQESQHHRERRDLRNARRVVPVLSRRQRHE